MALRLAFPRVSPLTGLICFSRTPHAYEVFTRRRAYSSEQSPLPTSPDHVQPGALEQLLAEPTWSVESLLPPKNRAPDSPRISSKELHHLLRLSALPPPDSPAAEEKMLDTLSAQLHFVGEIQQVNTSGVSPLRALRDETAAAEQEHIISVESLKDALANEQVVGKHYKRIQRNTKPVEAKDAEDWDVLGSAERKVGKYFVVESQMPQD